jgi:outer membrane protein
LKSLNIYKYKKLKFKVMLKKIVVLLFCALPMFAMAQDKFGHVNSGEIIMSMPEIAEVQRAMDARQSEWEGILMSAQEELFTKFREFQDRQATMPESIREVRQSELVELEQRAASIRQQAQQDLEQEQQRLFAPVIERARRAIEEVGTEHNFTYIFDLATESIVFLSPTANDVTPLVKAKLGIR